MLELLRQYRRRTATRWGVAFASLWLVFAAVPCSAMEQVGIDLGHQHAAAAASPSGHGCPHCPPEAPSKGAIGATPGDCAGLDDAVVTKVVQLDLVLAAPQALPQPAPVATDALASSPLSPDRDRPPAVPLNLRFCTFLE